MDINDLTYQINGAIFEANKEIHSLKVRNPFPLPMSAEGKVCVRPW
jgi:hypothetical protein